MLSTASIPGSAPRCGLITNWPWSLAVVTITAVAFAQLYHTTTTPERCVNITRPLTALRGDNKPVVLRSAHPGTTPQLRR